MCGEERAPTDRALDVHHIPGLMDGGCNADELLTSLCNECHKKAEHYLRTIPEIEFVLCDWFDDELPEGRERWTPDMDTTEAERFIEPDLNAAREYVTEEWEIPESEVERGFERIEESVVQSGLDRWT
jgi:NMD protein affecting ribosome stability and mRNA decay